VSIISVFEKIAEVPKELKKQKGEELK